MGYKNKSLIIGMMLFPLSAMAGFIHPMDFDGSEAQKQEVIQYIKDRVQQDYCNSQLDMCQPSMLRMMEDQNLSSFKKATKATDRKVMDRVISDYCNSPVDMCNYDNILMMYNENLKASKKELTW